MDFSRKNGFLKIKEWISREKMDFPKRKRMDFRREKMNFTREK